MRISGVLTILAIGLAIVFAQSTCPNGRYNYFRITSDLTIQLGHHVDTHMQNPWGMAQSPNITSLGYIFPDASIWVVSQVLAVATVYDGNGAPYVLPSGDEFTVTFSPSGLRTPMDAYAESYPNEAMPVSIVFNDGPEFLVRLADNSTAPAPVIVGSLDCALHAWHPNLTATPPATTAHLVLSVNNSAFTGLAIAKLPDTNSTTQTSKYRLYAAELESGRVLAWDGNWAPVALNSTAFTDSTLSSDFAAYNVWVNGDSVYVTFTSRDPFSGDRPRTVGLGAVNTYDFDGNLKQRLLSGGVLNSPYGLAIAPPGFGPAGGMLIVGNHGDGQFWGFDLANPNANNGLNILSLASGDPVGEGINLKAIQFGNGQSAQSTDSLFWVRGVGERETHGLLGRIDPVGC